MLNGEQVDRARRLMRDGLSDEAIEARTGLAPLAILEIRAKASVEEAAAIPRRAPAAGARHRL